MPVRAAFARAWAAAVFLALTAVTGAAWAHVIGVSRGNYSASGSRVDAELTLRTDDAMLAASGLDADGDGKVSDRELGSGRSAIQTAFVDELSVAADGAPCTGRLGELALDPPDGLRLRASYDCPREPRHLHLHFGFLDRLPSDHRHLATVHAPGGDQDVLAVLARPDFDVDLGAASGASHGFASLLRAGVEHILTGADHLAFLLALVLGATLITSEGGRVGVGALVAMLTAFTVGHSASLAIATLAGFAPGPRLVEPAVAMSVAYVGAENLFTKSVRHRWLLTLPFGFVHGFAFAGGLIPLGIPRQALPGALLGFNLGVEVGQLAVLALLLPGLVLLHRRAWYPRSARAASAAIAVLGVGWFVQRVAG